MLSQEVSCRICQTPAQAIGVKRGKWRSLDYQLYRCPHCQFAFVGNPSTDYDQIYTLDYYNGKGADPLTNYLFELQEPTRTVRQYEWQGITSIVSQLKPLSTNTRWLDFGCGNGGLVRWVNTHHNCPVVGFEEGEIAELARQQGIPILTREALAEQSGCYDVITAIEVLEHVEQPLDVLRQIHQLLKPGGVFFYTTGNAQKFRSTFLDWSYVTPEIHISFFEPETMAYALSKVGFGVKHLGYLRGFEDVIRFKVLKALQWRTITLWEKLLPWFIIGPLLDRKFGCSAFAIGFKD